MYRLTASPAHLPPPIVSLFSFNLTHQISKGIRDLPRTVIITDSNDCRAPFCSCPQDDHAPGVLKGQQPLHKHCKL